MVIIYSTQKVDLTSLWNLDSGEWKKECSNIPADLPVLDNSNFFSRIIGNNALLKRQSEPGVWYKRIFDKYPAKNNEIIVFKALHRFVSGGDRNRPLLFEHAFHIYDKKNEIFSKESEGITRVFDSAIAVAFGALKGATKITSDGIWVWHNPNYIKLAKLGGMTTDTWYIMTSMFKLPTFTRNMIQEESGKVLFDSGWINSQPYIRKWTGKDFKLLLSIESVNECEFKIIHDVKDIILYTEI